MIKFAVLFALIVAVQQPTSAMQKAEDVTGTWQIMLSAPDGRQETGTAVLKQSGTQVTGWVGRDDQDQNVISDGTIKESKFTAKIIGRNATQTLDLTVKGNEMTGTVTRADGRQATVKFTRNPK
jgi:hypothetical protein